MGPTLAPVGERERERDKERERARAREREREREREKDRGRDVRKMLRFLQKLVSSTTGQSFTELSF